MPKLEWNDDHVRRMTSAKGRDALQELLDDALNSAEGKNVETIKTELGRQCQDKFGNAPSSEQLTFWAEELADGIHIQVHAPNE